MYHCTGYSCCSMINVKKKYRLSFISIIILIGFLSLGCLPLSTRSTSFSLIKKLRKTPKSYFLIFPPHELENLVSFIFSTHPKEKSETYLKNSRFKRSSFKGTTLAPHNFSCVGQPYPKPASAKLKTEFLSCNIDERKEETAKSRKKNTSYRMSVWSWLAARFPQNSYMAIKMLLFHSPCTSLD